MSEPNPTTSGRSAQGMRRRDFLALGAATAAASTLASSRASAAIFAERSALGVDLLSGEPISVGYVLGSDEWWQNRLDLPWDDPDASPMGFELEIVPAESMTVGSQLAETEVELTVHGLFPRLPRPGASAWKTLYMFASMPAAPEMIFGPDPVPFLAWSARMDPQPSEAAKVRPILPTGVDGALRVGLELRNPPTKGSTRGGLTRPAALPAVLERTANFTVDDIVGRPKLQQGLYLLGCGAGVWDRPWSGTLDQLRRHDGLDSVAIGIRLPG